VVRVQVRSRSYRVWKGQQDLGRSCEELPAKFCGSIDVLEHFEARRDIGGGKGLGRVEDTERESWERARCEGDRLFVAVDTGDAVRDPREEERAVTGATPDIDDRPSLAELECPGIARHVDLELSSVSVNARHESFGGDVPQRRVPNAIRGSPELDLRVART
jgi:hypothetical protein